MERLTDDRFLKDGFYQPKNKDEEKEIRSMGKDLTFEKLYRHCAELEKKNAELQKQVDELKEERKNMQAEIIGLESQKEDLYFQNKNLQTYIDNHEPIWKRNTEQAVKDTAKEIFVEQKKFICNKWKQYMTENELVEFAEERYGVEVE
ncbi:MAG: hypothetical protein IIX02_00370 [Clostridia bacterium]|nr:hypothetical protein [Clostridia bacterium]